MRLRRPKSWGETVGGNLRCESNRQDANDDLAATREAATRAISARWSLSTRCSTTATPPRTAPSSSAVTTTASSNRSPIQIRRTRPLSPRCVAI